MSSRSIDVNRNTESNMSRMHRVLVVLSIIGCVAFPFGSALECYVCIPSETETCKEVNDSMVQKCPAVTPPITSSTTSGGSSTEKPATGGSSTEKPATGGSSTEKPATGGSSTEKPATGGSSTEKPATGGSSTEKPATGGSSTEKPATGGSSTEKPATGGSSTEATTTEATTTEESTTEATTTEESTTEEGTTEEGTTEEGTTEEGTTEEGTTEEGTTEEGTTEEGTTKEGTIEESITKRSNSEESNIEAIANAGYLRNKAYYARQRNRRSLMDRLSPMHPFADEIRCFTQTSDGGANVTRGCSTHENVCSEGDNCKMCNTDKCNSATSNIVFTSMVMSLVIALIIAK